MKWLSPFRVLAVSMLVLLSWNAEASKSATMFEQATLNAASQAYLDGQLQLSAEEQESMECMTKVIWYESRGESELGKTYVANVVRNRVKPDAKRKPFATSICKVVYQPNQFAWTRNSKKKHADFRKIAQKAMKNEGNAVHDTIKIALKQVLLEPKTVTNATHFCSIGEKCNFSGVQKLGKIGGHTFFKYEKES